MKNISAVCLLDDVLRDQYLSARGFIYSVIQEPIRQAVGISYPDTNKFPGERGMANGFDLAEFRGACGGASWQQVYRGLQPQAEEYLASHIPDNSLVIGYEMPPWLIILLEKNNFIYVNVRISPIRFCRDLYLCISSNMDGFYARLSEFNVGENEVRLEAGLLRASIQQKNIKEDARKISGGFIFIGQTENDASLISHEGAMLSVIDFPDEIKHIVGDKSLAYKPHPYGFRFSKEERKQLQNIVGRRVPVVRENIYNLIASKADFELISISSGACQEAQYFNKNSYFLFEPICDPYKEINSMSHVRFIDFCSPELWARVFGVEAGVSRQGGLSYGPENLMRSFHDVWWGYSEYMIDNNQFWKQVVLRSLANTGAGLFSSLVKRIRRTLWVN